MKHFENSNARVILNKDRQKSLLNRHPWIFSGAVDRIEGEFQPGEVLAVYSAEGEFLAKGFVNPRSQIVVRILTFQDEPVGEEFFLRRLRRAAELRQPFIPPHTNAYRLVHSDGDGLPGLIVDKYDAALVMQIFSRGMDRLRADILDWLRQLFDPDIVVEKSEARVLAEEGLEPRREVLVGEYRQPIQILEAGLRYEVDLLEGQKTGFFLDQRENRQRIGELAAGKRLLNGFSYTGGFSLAAARKGATTVSVEISESAQQLARRNFELNDLDPSRHGFITADVFDYLREMEEKFDVIVLDPPAFVKKKKHIQRGARGYKDINRLAMQKIVPGGYLLSCSCSHYINWDLFQKILFSAAAESQREVQVIGKFSQPPDHPFSIYHPEGEYLKSFLLKVW